MCFWGAALVLGPVTGAFSLDDAETRTFTHVSPGNYQVVEGAMPGYELTAIDCTVEGVSVPGDLASRTANISLQQAGGSAHCTFTNTKDGMIIIEKQTLPDGDPQLFDFFGDVGGLLGDGDTASTLLTTHTYMVPGTYTASLDVVDDDTGVDVEMMEVIVVDEFGSAVGILTMEDVFEEVVGEIDVGYDFDEYNPKQRAHIEHESENSHVMSGRMPISEVNDILYVQFPVEEAHTIGGLIISRLRHIPTVGDAVTEQDYRLTVLEADERSVLKVRAERI